MWVCLSARLLLFFLLLWVIFTHGLYSNVDALQRAKVTPRPVAGAESTASNVIRIVWIVIELNKILYTLNTCHHRRKKNKTQQTKKNMYYASAQLIKCIFNETEAICVLQAGQFDWSRKLAAFILGRINVLNYNAYAIRYVCTICKRANTDRQRLGCERREWTNKQTIQIKYAYILTTWIDIVYTTKTYICIYILFNLHIVSVNLETRK